MTFRPLIHEANGGGSIQSCSVLQSRGPKAPGDTQTEQLTPAICLSTHLKPSTFVFIHYFSIYLFRLPTRPELTRSGPDRCASCTGLRPGWSQVSFNNLLCARNALWNDKVGISMPAGLPGGSPSPHTNIHFSTPLRCQIHLYYQAGSILMILFQD